MIFSSTAPRIASYLFIDGNNVARTVEKFAEVALDGRIPPIRWEELRSSHRKAFYYDAIPARKRDEDEAAYEHRSAAKREQLREVERLAGYHVRSGSSFHEGTRRERQKKVDVQLAVDALLWASRGLFDAATLMAGDLDFMPLVTALVEMGVDVTLLYPPGETNSDLIASADNAYPLTPGMMLNWLDLESVGITRPRAAYNVRTGIYEYNEVLTSWIDTQFGQCWLSKEGLFTYQLTTERAPNNPDDYYLEVSCDRLQLLRMIVSSSYGIDIPEI